MNDELTKLLRKLFDELPHPALLEAADRIEKYRSALQEIWDSACDIQEADEIAAEALGIE